jgi:hypothetical protein
MLALREHFLVPGDDERFNVIHGDGRPVQGPGPRGKRSLSCRVNQALRDRDAG